MLTAMVTLTNADPVSVGKKQGVQSKTHRVMLSEFVCSKRFHRETQTEPAGSTLVSSDRVPRKLNMLPCLGVQAEHVRGQVHTIPDMWLQGI